MSTEKQRQASRINGSKSRGPITPEGKAVSRFNGVKHGLRAVHVTLPGEDPAHFEAELGAWFGDWRPISHTRAILVERAAVTSWRLRRSVKAEAAFLAHRADAAGYAFDSERFNRVERALARADVDAVAAVSLLELDATGIDRLILAGTELAAALELGPSAWNQPVFHIRLMGLLGHRADEDPQLLGGVPRASSRLLAAHNAAYAADPGIGHCVVAHPLPQSEFASATELLRGAVSERLERLRGLRSGMPEPAALKQRAMSAAYVDGTEEGKLRLRYEMALDRSLRATIGQLIALEKSGADLAGASEEAGSEGESAGRQSTEVISFKSVKTHDGSGPSTAVPPAPGSLGAADLGSVPAVVAAPIGGPKAPNRPPARAGGGGSPR